MNKRNFLKFIWIVPATSIASQYSVTPAEETAAEKLREALHDLSVIYVRSRSHELITKKFNEETKQTFEMFMTLVVAKYDVVQYKVSVEDLKNVDEFLMDIYWNYAVDAPYHSMRLHFARDLDPQIKHGDI